MKREDLKTNGLTDEQIDFVMAENGKDIEAQKSQMSKKDETIESLRKERDGLKSQVEQRDKDIAAMKTSAGDNETLSKKLDELKEKYEADTAALKKELDDQSVDFALKSLFGEVKFSSALAKKAAIAEFKATNPVLKDGKFQNADEFIKGLRESNPDAFPKESDDNDQVDPGLPNPSLNTLPEQRLPKFTTGIKQPEQNGGKTNPFSFGFQQIRQTKKE